MANRSVDIDDFAIALTSLLEDANDAMTDAAADATRKSIRSGAKLLRGEYTDGIGRHPWSDEYRGGFRSQMTHEGNMPSGEIGNKAKPGLVHLLEKGHLTPNGTRSTAKFPHMAPAFEEIQEDFVSLMQREIGRALEK